MPIISKIFLHIFSLESWQDIGKHAWQPFLRYSQTIFPVPVTGTKNVYDVHVASVVRRPWPKTTLRSIKHVLHLILTF